MAKTLANLLSSVRNAVTVGKVEMFAMPTSGISTEVLRIMQSRGYIQEFEMIDDGRGKVYKIKLLHTINNCGAISPRTPVRVSELEKWEKRYLPAQGFGLLLLTTSAGILTHEEARKKGLGGKLVAFVY